MKINNTVFLLPMLAMLLSGYGVAYTTNTLNTKDEPVNDPAFQYNCELTVLDASSKEVLSNKILRNGYNEESVTPTPPGNGRALLLQESAGAGLVDAYDMYMPARTIKNFFKKEPEQATIKIYRRLGVVESDPVLGVTILRVDSDTLLGQIEVKGTSSQTVQIEKYLFDLACVQNPDKK